MNGITWDNRRQNLKWDTQKENLDYRCGTRGSNWAELKQEATTVTENKRFVQRVQYKLPFKNI